MLVVEFMITGPCVVGVCVLGTSVVGACVVDVTTGGLVGVGIEDEAVIVTLLIVRSPRKRHPPVTFFIVAWISLVFRASSSSNLNVAMIPPSSTKF